MGPCCLGSIRGRTHDNLQRNARYLHGASLPLGLAAFCVIAAFALVGPAPLVPVAYAEETVVVSDQRSSASTDGDDDDAEILLYYEGSGLYVERAALGDLLFLELSVAFEESAPLSGSHLTLVLLNDVFDPVFNDDYEILLIADAGPHDDFVVNSNRTLLIQNIPFGIEAVDLYLDRVADADDVDITGGLDADVPREDVPEAPQDMADADKTESELTDTHADNMDNTDVAVPEDVSDADIEITPDDSTNAALPPPPLPIADSDIDSDVADAATDALESETPELLPPPESDANTILHDACGPGTVLVDGICEIDDSPEHADSDDTCGPGTVLVDGICEIDDSPEHADSDATGTAPSNTSGQSGSMGFGRDLVFATVAGFVVAGAVGVIFALMARASRRKRTVSDSTLAVDSS